MKIAFDAKRLFRNRTGLGNYSRTILRQLMIHHPENEYHLYGSKVENTDLFADIAANSSSEIHYSEANLKAFWRSYGIKKDLKADKMELFHGLSNELPIGLDKINLPSIVTIHDLIFKQYPKTFPFFDRKVYDSKFKYAAKHATKVLAISQSTKNDLQHFYEIDEKQIEVIYQSCDPLFYNAVSEEKKQSIRSKYQLDKEFILCVSSLEDRKNIETLLIAYSLIPHSLRIPLVIIGRGSLAKTLSLKAEEIKIHEQVHFLQGVSDNSELQAFYSLCHLLIYPSMFEGFGLPIVEALLNEAPVITADNSSLREAGGPNSVYFETMSSDDLAKKIQLVLNEEDLRKRMAQLGNEYARAEFDLKLQSDKLVTLYKNCI